MVESIDELPTKIADAVRATLKPSEVFRLALKTAFKPDATVPIIWLTITTHRLLFANTHARRFIWREIPFAELNCVRLRRDGMGNLAFEVITNSTTDEPLVMPLPSSVTRSIAQDFIDNCAPVRSEN